MFVQIQRGECVVMDGDLLQRTSGPVQRSSRTVDESMNDRSTTRRVDDGYGSSVCHILSLLPFYRSKTTMMAACIHSLLAVHSIIPLCVSKNLSFCLLGGMKSIVPFHWQSGTRTSSLIGFGKSARTHAHPNGPDYARFP